MPGTAHEERQYKELLRRYCTNAGTGVDIPIANGATSQAVTFADQGGTNEPNVNYGVMITTSYITTFRVAQADKSVSGFTVHFGTAAGASDTFDYMIFRQ